MSTYVEIAVGETFLSNASVLHNNRKGVTNKATMGIIFVSKLKREVFETNGHEYPVTCKIRLWINIRDTYSRKNSNCPQQ